MTSEKPKKAKCANCGYAIVRRSQGLWQHFGRKHGDVFYLFTGVKDPRHCMNAQPSNKKRIAPILR